jgi:polyphosphate kinase 2 (PPK2 family)
MGLESYSRWYDYARARDDTFAATHTARAPGTSCTLTTSAGAG